MMLHNVNQLSGTGLTYPRPTPHRPARHCTRRFKGKMPAFTVIRDTTPAEAIPRGAVVAMGNFDGVHLGHRAVIAAALEMGRAHRRPALAPTFEPHPGRLLRPPPP